ncbi:endothelin-converting enzyme homolog isoform X1 [Mytilus californianus]|uniref:endothelin-converting enzyme homolog isoform X1 n=1 Tax=Mytilus californianus TaxID=6549 RepID=UPI00224870B0|nr:endothelin-converting enzyme homolog isoform X1 [Mytilus californianus]
MTNYGTESPCLLGVPEVKFVKPGKNRQSTEKNELLNNTEVKMRDFESIDSEDFLDEENNFCGGKCICMRQRTCIEKFLFVFLIIAVCVIIALIAKSSGKSSHAEIDSICKTKGCIDVASSVLSSVDNQVKPCDDFYKYACGGWEKNTPIPPGYSYWDRTQELAYKNMYQLHELLESYRGTSDAINKAKKFHDSCLHEENTNKSAIIQKFRNLIGLISGTETNYTFSIILERIHQLNTWPLFTVSVGPDEWQDDTNVIKISQSDMPYPIDALIEEEKSQKEKYLKWDAKQVRQKYLADMSKTLRMFWNKSEIESLKIAEDMLELEVELANKTRSNDEIEFSRADVYKNTTVTEFQQKCSMIDWELYLTTLTYQTTKIVNTDKIVILHEDKLISLCGIVENTIQDNSSVLYYYLLVHAVRSFMPYFEVSQFTDISEQTELEFDGELWRRCTFYTNKAFGFATAAMYVNATSQNDNIIQIEQLITDVKESFKGFVLRNVWFRGNVREKATQKIDEMLDKISYPTYIMKQSFLDQFYKFFEVKNYWFENLKSWKEFEVTTMFSELGKKTDRKRWIRPPFRVESDYDPVRNNLNFPTAMLHLPFYTADGPITFNYGTLAAIVGHEITHAFDILGRQYNAKGKLENWWDPLTVSSFNQTVKCMKDQYDNYIIDGQKVNGYKTLDENIADNGGLRAAFFAYQLWERKGESKKILPGVDLSNRQLFFTSYAQMFCSKWKPEGLQKHLIDDRHNPGPIRVRGSVSNMETFASAFNCPFISHYNPTKKCRVW